MTVFFTSDLHLGHRKVAAIRGFDSVDDHDDALKDHWVDAVGPRDQVWVLGDIAISSPNYALDVLRRLPGQKHLIWGNHDMGHPMYRDAHVKYGRYLDVFHSAAQSARRRIDGVEVLLSHFPYHHDRDDVVRFPQWRLRDEGAWLLHGHTHSGVVREAPRQVHVGVDAHGLRPVDMDTIAALISAARTEDARRTTVGETPSSKRWLYEMAAEGVPNWAALEAWNEAEDSDTVGQIRARALVIAERGPRAEDEEFESSFGGSDTPRSEE